MLWGLSDEPIAFRRHRAAQRGVVLFVALIVLIVMTLAGLALLRQMGAGTSIAGNVAFKENATSVADRGTEVARRWLIANTATPRQRCRPEGYHSSWAGSVDPTTFDLDRRGVARCCRRRPAQTGNTGRGHHPAALRDAEPERAAPTQLCSDSPGQPAGRRGGGGSTRSILSDDSTAPFYRVTTRVDGPRNTSATPRS